MENPESEAISRIQAVAAAMVAQFKQNPDDADAISSVGKRMAEQFEMNEVDTAKAFDLAISALGQMRKS